MKRHTPTGPALQVIDAKRRRRKRRIGIAAAILALLILGVIFGVPWAINRGWFNGYIQRQLSSALQMDVRFDRLQIRGWSSLRVELLNLSTPGETNALMHLPSAEVDFSLLGLWRGKVKRLRLEHPQINAAFDERGQLSFTKPASSPATSPPPSDSTAASATDWNSFFRVDQFELADGSANVTSPNGTASFAGINVHLESTPTTADIWNVTAKVSVAEFSLETKDGVIEGANASLTSSFNVNTAKREADVEAFHFQSSFEGLGRAETSFQLKQRVVSALRVDLNQLNAATLGKWLAVFAPQLPISELNGKIRVTLVSERLSFDSAEEQGTVGLRIEASDMAFIVPPDPETKGAKPLRFSELNVTQSTTISFHNRFTHADFNADTALSRADFALGSLTASGGADAEIKEGSGFKVKSGFGKFSVQMDDAQAVIREAARFTDLILPQVDGKLSLTGSVGFNGEENKVVARVETNFAGERIRYALPKDLLERLEENTGSLQMTGVQARVEISSSFPVPNFSDGTLSMQSSMKADEVAAILGARIEKVSGVKLEATASSDLGLKQWHAPHVVMEIADTFGATVSGSLTAKDSHVEGAQLSVSHVDIKRVWGELVKRMPAMKSPYEPEGALDVSVRYVAQEDKVGRAIIEANGEKIMLTSSNSAAEISRFRNTLTVTFDGVKPLENPFKFQLKTSLANPYLAYDAYEMDFTGQEAVIEGNGTFNMLLAEFGISSLRLIAGNLFEAGLKDVAAEFSTPSFTGQLSLTSANLATTFDDVIKKNFGRSSPLLQTATLKGGVTFVGAFSQNDETAAVNGQLQLNDLSAHMAGAELENVRGSIPVQLGKKLISTAEMPAAPPVTDAVKITIGKLSAGTITFQNLELRPRIVENRFILAALPSPTGERAAALDLPLFNGRFTLWDFTTNDLLLGKTEMTARFRLDNLDSAALLPLAGMPAYPGKVNCPNGELFYSEKDLSLLGDFTTTICDGKILVRDVKMTRAFSTSPVLETDVEFDGLDLRQLTSAVPGFGIISGVLEGHARRVKISTIIDRDGKLEKRPYSLDLDLHAVPQKGVKQRIDRDAVGSVVLLATGEAQPAITALMIFGGIDYKIFGLKCRINNDEVEIEGIKKVGEKYVVLESTLTSVPRLAITVSVGRPISYDDVLERLKKAGESAKEKAGEK